MPLSLINVNVIPTDLLINEKVNAKLFQFKLKRMGIALSLWEVFTLFEMLLLNLRSLLIKIMWANV